MFDKTNGRSLLTHSAAMASVFTAVLLLGLKLWATAQSGSTAMLASLTDTGLDLLASVMTLIAVAYAARPADEDHRFGHGKAEALAAGIQMVLIGVAAVLVAISAIKGLIAPAADEVATGPAITVSIIAIVLTIALISYQRFVVSRTGSIAIKADAMHYQADLLLNASVIGAMMMQAFTTATWIDPLCGLAIAAWLAHGAWDTANEALDHLMDREWDEERREKLILIVAGHREVSNLHDLRTRTSGSTHFAQFHVDMPKDVTVGEAHDIIDNIEADLAKEFPNTEVIIHIDPKGHVDEPENPLRETNEFEVIDLDSRRKAA